MLLLRANQSSAGSSVKVVVSSSRKTGVGLLWRAIPPFLLWGLVVVGGGCPQQASDPLIEIRELHEKRHFRESIERLRALVDEDPDRAETNFLLGKALMRTGEPSLAIWSLRRAAESPDYRVEANLMLTRIMLGGRTPSDAIGTIDQVLALEPENVEALVLRVQAYLREGRREDALADIARVVELDPENLPILVPRVLALIELERIDEAEEALETARDKVESTEREVSEEIRGRLCVANALFAFEKGDAESAEAQYTDCLEVYPTNQIVVEHVVRFYDGSDRQELATETLQRAFEESRDSFFRGTLARRMGRLGEPEEQERLMREEAEEQGSSAAWFNLGDLYVRRENYAAACTAFEQALAAEPNPAPMVRFAYADTLIAAGRYKQAEQIVAEVEQAHLRDLLQGRILLAQGDARGALQSFESGIRLWPNNPGARFLAGQAAERLGDFDRALSEYRESVRANPAATEAGLHLARILDGKGEYTAGSVVLRPYLRAHPRERDAYILAIRMAYSAGHPEAASELLSRLSRVPGEAPTAVVEHMALIAADPNGGGPQAAVDALARSRLDLTDPANAAALRALLEQLAALGEHDEARVRAAAALDAHPEEPVFHELAARALRAAGGPGEEVRKSLERAIELDPEQTGALIVLAELSAEAGDDDAAIALYDRATRIAEEDPRAAREAIELLRSLGRTEEALLRLATLLETHPHDARAANDLAQILAARGEDLDRALAYAKRADYFFYSVPEAPETLGWIHLLRGEPEPAIEALTRALELRPEATSARYRLGLALAAQGDKERARQAFLEVVRAGALEAEQARSEIARLDGAD